MAIQHPDALGHEFQLPGSHLYQSVSAATLCNRQLMKSMNIKGTRHVYGPENLKRNGVAPRLNSETGGEIKLEYHVA